MKFLFVNCVCWKIYCVSRSFIVPCLRFLGRSFDSVNCSISIAFFARINEFENEKASIDAKTFSSNEKGKGLIRLRWYEAIRQSFLSVARKKM